MYIKHLYSIKKSDKVLCYNLKFYSKYIYLIQTKMKITTIH